MKLQAKRDFNELAQFFLEGNFNLGTVSNLIILVRRYRNEISEIEAKKLLEIPLNILENDVELIDENNWASRNADYFAGNITWVDGDFEKTWKNKFHSEQYGLEEIYELCKIVSDNFEEHRSSCEFLLRNIEVTIRDDVKVEEYSNFFDSGNVFALHILKAINID